MHSDQDIERLWTEKVCKEHDEISTLQMDEMHWSSIWAGFVLALDRPDLIGYQSYMKLGFPHEAPLT